MKHSDKPAGMTVAEALGLRIPATAPGGQRLLSTEGSQRSTRRRQAHQELMYDGIADLDAYARGDHG